MQGVTELDPGTLPPELLQLVRSPPDVRAFAIASLPDDGTIASLLPAIRLSSVSACARVTVATPAAAEPTLLEDVAQIEGSVRVDYLQQLRASDAGDDLLHVPFINGSIGLPRDELPDALWHECPSLARKRLLTSKDLDGCPSIHYYKSAPLLMGTAQVIENDVVVSHVVVETMHEVTCRSSMMGQSYRWIRAPSGAVLVGEAIP